MLREDQENEKDEEEEHSDIPLGKKSYLFKRYMAEKTTETATNNEPVFDLVYTWVNGADEKWLAEKHKWMKKEKPKSFRSYEGTRYQNLNELKYSLRSVQQFAPFFRKIFIVTNGQVPSWLNTKHPKIQMISHEEIFPHEKYLPTFNSIAIEANLHHIPGLSEYFVYMNDDVFFGRTLKKKKFVTEDGKTKIYLRNKFIPNRSGYSMTKYDFKDGIHHTHMYLNKVSMQKKNRYAHHHVGFALRKSILNEIEALLKKTGDWEKTLTRFRQNQNIKLISFFYPHYCLEKGYAVNDPKIIATKVSQYHYQYYPKILEEKPHMFCINSLQSMDGSARNFFSRYFPKPSKFEKQVQPKKRAKKNTGKRIIVTTKK